MVFEINHTILVQTDFVKVESVVRRGKQIPILMVWFNPLKIKGVKYFSNEKWSGMIKPIHNSYLQL